MKLYDTYISENYTLSSILIQLTIVITTLCFIFKLSKKPKGLPPGPWGLPIIGALPPTSVKMRDYIEDLRKQLGDIFMNKFGSRIFVILSDYDLIRQVFAKSEFTGRPDFHTSKIATYFENRGLIVSEQKSWQDNRKFSLTHLTNLGMGKSVLEDTVMEEVSVLLKYFDDNVDTPCELSWTINTAVLNVIWGLVASKRYNIDDPEIQHFSNLVGGNFDIIQGPGLFLDLFPAIPKYLPEFIVDKYFKIGTMKSSVETVYKFILKIMKEHEQNLDMENPKDYIDLYLVEIQKQKEDPYSIFNIENLKVCIGDLFVAGSETTSSTIRWGIFYLIKNPEIQKKVQKEIDEQVPHGTLLSLEHKERLPYLEATILEILRKSSLVVLGVPHTALVDTKISEYDIPKGTLIFANIEGCHNDPKYFEKPDEFYPEHFLDENGKVITKKKGFVPFSVGRRACLGESLAKMELYLFLGAILQRYTLSESPDNPIQVEEDRNNILINTIKPYTIMFSKRE